jgi:exosortase K
VRRGKAIDLALLALALVAAYALKRHYSDDGVDRLGWILAPTATLVELVTGREFVPETGVGYLGRESFFVIAKPCAGVNFLIVAFVASVVAFVRGRRTVAGKLALVAGSALGAYAAALLANTVRIAIAVELHPRLADLGAAARERLHHAEGVAVYLVALLLGLAAARRLLDGPGPGRRTT